MVPIGFCSKLFAEKCNVKLMPNCPTCKAKGIKSQGGLVVKLKDKALNSGALDNIQYNALYVRQPPHK